MSIEKKKKKFQMPSAMIVLFAVLVFVAVLTWIVPVSVVKTDANGKSTVVYNASFDAKGKVVKGTGTQPAGLWDLFLAPIKGFQNGADVSFAILVSGAFLAVINSVGALDAGIGKLLKKYSGKTLLAILMLVFALMGAVYGAWEELPAYGLVLIPLCVKAGYDVMTGIGVLFVGATIGNMASIVNPFSTGAAVAAIGNDKLSLGVGIGMRIFLFIAMYLVGTFLVIRYAEGVRKDFSKSVLYGVEGINPLTDDTNADNFPELTRQRKWSLIVFAILVIVIILGYMPWASIPVGDHTMYDVINAPINYLNNHLSLLGNLLGTHTFTPLGDWYFNEFTWVFLVGSVIIAMINKIGAEGYVKSFTSGCRDMIGMVSVIAISRGISLLMGSKTSGISVTFVYWIRGILQNVPVWAFVVAAVAAYVVIGLFLQGTSSVAGITMPILGAVAMALFANRSIGAEGGQMVLISAFTVGLNFMCGLFPEATKMGMLEICNTPYDRFLKYMMRMTIPVLVVATVCIMICTYMGLV